MNAYTYINTYICICKYICMCVRKYIYIYKYFGSLEDFVVAVLFVLFSSSFLRTKTFAVFIFHFQWPYKMSSTVRPFLLMTNWDLKRLNSLAKTSQLINNRSRRSLAFDLKSVLLIIGHNTTSQSTINFKNNWS